MSLSVGLGAAWGEAAGLVVSSDVMAVVVTVTLVVSWFVAGALRVRAALPGASATTCLSVGTSVLVDLPSAGNARARRAGLVGAAGSVSFLVVGPISVAAVVLLLTRGHTPLGWPAPAAAAAAAALTAGAALLALRRHRRARDETGHWLSSRGPHLGAATLVGEAAVAGAVVAALALAHTEGADISPLEIFAATLVARLTTLVRFPPAGLGVADVVLAALLLAVGASLPVAIATVALWRLGLVAVWAGSLLLSRRPDPRVDVLLAGPGAPTGSAAGELFHRSAFRTLAWLPRPLARRARRWIFEAMFSASTDPWQYDSMPYEVRKRSLLTASIPPGVASIVEVGCADGHNLLVWGRTHPEARVVGVDISPRAVETVVARAAGLPNVTAIESDVAGAAAALAAAHLPAAEVVVLSEVLYYLGDADDVRRELRHLGSALSAGCLVVLLHPPKDAEALHPAAFEALGATIETKRLVPDPERPYVLQTGRLTHPS